MSEFGTLYLVSTPIGNLEDITLRAIRILGEVDIIAAEDTRQTLKLLNHFNISKPLTSFFKHNEGKKGQAIIEKLKSGLNIALVSDAGTPGISDPGEELIAGAILEGIRIVPIPGPTAAISGLISSGLPTGSFTFEGFLPMNKRARKERLEELKKEKRTMVFYEAPHKLKNTLKDMFKTFGDRKIALCREITKYYEEFIRMTIADAIDYYEENIPKGEFVLVIEGETGVNAEVEKVDNSSAIDLVIKYMESGMEKKEAMKKVAKEKGIAKNEIYRTFIQNKD